MTVDVENRIERFGPVPFDSTRLEETLLVRIDAGTWTPFCGDLVAPCTVARRGEPEDNERWISICGAVADTRDSWMQFLGVLRLGTPLCGELVALCAEVVTDDNKGCTAFCGAPTDAPDSWMQTDDNESWTSTCDAITDPRGSRVASLGVLMFGFLVNSICPTGAGDGSYRNVEDRSCASRHFSVFSIGFSALDFAPE